MFCDVELYDSQTQHVLIAHLTRDQNDYRMIKLPSDLLASPVTESVTLTGSSDHTAALIPEQSVTAAADMSGRDCQAVTHLKRHELQPEAIFGNFPGQVLRPQRRPMRIL